MASDEPTNPSSAAASLLPQYPELILAAIEALDDKNGVNKSTISKHIEDTIDTLPAAHTTLLSHHLNKMKASGQLIMLKNNYLKPDPDAPPRRGRGRPPKVKDPSAPATPAAVSLSPARGRGRPPKPRDPLAPVPTQTKTKAESSGRKRGRPSKKGKASAGDTPRVVPLAATGATRGRGRPPKVKTPVAAPVGA